MPAEKLTAATTTRTSGQFLKKNDFAEWLILFVMVPLAIKEDMPSVVT
jgi:hypothetical protein